MDRANAPEPRPRLESDFTAFNSLCPNIELWHSTDSMAAELEVSDFMYAMVRLLKPRLVVETGCYAGATSVTMARALKDNCFGRLVTCDTAAEHVRGLKRISQQESLPIEVFCTTGVELLARFDKISLAYIDSGGIREQEIQVASGRIERFGIIALHDTAPHHFESRIQDSVNLPYLYLNTPRGLTLFQVR